MFSCSADGIFVSTREFSKEIQDILSQHRPDGTTYVERENGANVMLKRQPLRNNRFKTFTWVRKSSSAITAMTLPIHPALPCPANPSEPWACTHNFTATARANSSSTGAGHPEQTCPGFCLFPISRGIPATGAEVHSPKLESLPDKPPTYQSNYTATNTL